MTLPDGSRAENNATLVAAAVRIVAGLYAADWYASPAPAPRETGARGASHGFAMVE